MLESNLENLIIHKPSLGSREVPQKLGLVGTAVLTFIGYKQTNSQTSKVYVYILYLVQESHISRCLCLVYSSPEVPYFEGYILLYLVKKSHISRTIFYSTCSRSPIFPGLYSALPGQEVPYFQDYVLLYLVKKSHISRCILSPQG